MENNMNLTNKEKALAIFKWTIRKYLPMSIAYWILLFISFPMVLMFEMMVAVPDSGIKGYIDIMNEIASGISGTFFAAVVILFSVIVAIILFSYMHNKRSVDLFGSFPVSRRTLFFTRYIAALVICIVPLIVFGTMGALLTLSDIAMLAVFKNIGYLILGIIGNVSFIAFISVCCGTVVDVLVSYALINVVYPICVTICYFFPVSIIPGLQGGYIGASVFTLFSPIAAPYVGMFGTSKTLHILWWIFFTIVLVAGCYVLCKKRKAETAQNAFAFATVEIVIKFVTCFAAGFGVGWIFANIGESTHGTIKGQYAWFFVGLFIGIMVANFLLHLVFHRGLSKYLNSLMECGVVAVATTVFLFVITTGAFGYDQRIPEADEIQSVSMCLDDGKFVVDGKDLLAVYREDAETIDGVLDVHSNLINKYEDMKKGIYPIIDGGSYISQDYYGDPYSVEVNYKLKNGKTISRGYNTSNIKIEVSNKLKQKFEVSDEYILNHIPEKYIYYLNVNKNGLSYSIDMVKGYKNSKAEKLIDALKKDIKEYGISNKSGSDGLEINISYEGDTYVYYSDIYIAIPDTYVNTLKVINDDKLFYSDYGWLKNDSCPYFTNKEVKDTPKDVVKTIYFKVPDTWNKDAEVKCMLYSQDWCGFYTELDSSLADCEKVSDDVWKYEIYDVAEENTDEEYAEEWNDIMFYQPSEDPFNFSGCLKIADDNNSMLVLGEKYKNRDIMDYSTAQYRYEWTTYNE